MLHDLPFRLRGAYGRQQLRLLDLSDGLRGLRAGRRVGGVLAVHLGPGHAVLPLGHQLHERLRRGQLRRRGRQLPAGLPSLRRALRQLHQRGGLHELRDGRARPRDDRLLLAVRLRLLREQQLDVRGLRGQLRLLLSPRDLHFLRAARRTAVLPLGRQRLPHELSRRPLRHDQQRRLPLRGLPDRLRPLRAVWNGAVLGVHDGGHDQLLPVGHRLPRHLPRRHLRGHHCRQAHLQRLHRALRHLQRGRHLRLQLLRHRQTHLRHQHLRHMHNRTVRKLSYNLRSL